MGRLKEILEHVTSCCKNRPLENGRSGHCLPERIKLMETVPQAGAGFGTFPRSLPAADGERCGQFRYGEFVVNPYGEARVLNPLLRYLRDCIPDVSAGVWAWVRLCSTPQRVSFTGGNETEQREAGRIVRRLDERIFEFDHMHQQGMDALVNSFFLSVFTYGAFAGEVVLKDDRSGIDKFFLIDPSSIRFKRYKTSRRLVPYQVTSDGEIIRLRESSFFYYALDADGNNPYGRSPLLSLPFVIRIQQQLLTDMAQATHNAGWPTLHVSYQPPKKEEGESQQVYQARIQSHYEVLKKNMQEKHADSNFVTLDSVNVKYVSPGGSAQKWSESLEAIAQQVIAGLHLAPFMIGRNYGTTQSWGLAQYRLMVNNAVSVQRGAKRMCEWLRNLELALAGSGVRSEHHFETHHGLDVIDQARAFESRTKALMELWREGLIGDDQVRRVLDME
jgi:hypothetical protein